jgi:hypothetical protein
LTSIWKSLLKTNLDSEPLLLITLFFAIKLFADGDFQLNLTMIVLARALDCKKFQRFQSSVTNAQTGHYLVMKKDSLSCLFLLQLYRATVSVPVPISRLANFARSLIAFDEA